MAIEDLHVREALVPGLTGGDLENGSFYGCWRPLRDHDRRRRADRRADGDERGGVELLGVPLHSPAFLFERITRSPHGDIVEYVRSIYRGDRYRLVTELGAAGAAGGRARRSTACDRLGTESGLDNWDANVPGSARGQVVQTNVGRPEAPLGHVDRGGTSRPRPFWGRSSMKYAPSGSRSSWARSRSRHSTAGAASAPTKRAANNLTVWLQVDAQSGWPDASRPRTRHSRQSTPAADVDVQYQELAGPPAEVRRHARGEHGPDVIEMGNTEMTKYMAAGAFADLTSKKGSFANSSTWLKGLAASGVYNGKPTASRTTPARASSRTAPTCSRRRGSRGAGEPRRVHAGARQARRRTRARASRPSTSPAPTGTSRWASSTTSAARSPRSRRQWVGTLDRKARAGSPPTRRSSRPPRRRAKRRSRRGRTRTTSTPRATRRR